MSSSQKAKLVFYNTDVYIGELSFAFFAGSKICIESFINQLINYQPVIYDFFILMILVAFVTFGIKWLENFRKVTRNGINFANLAIKDFRC